MQLLTVNTKDAYCSSDFKNRNPGFCHSHSAIKSDYKPSEKALIAGLSVMGVVTSLALMAKHAGYSLKPSKMFKNIKNSYFFKEKFLAPQVIAMGAGSCAGGLAGGLIVDKNKQNRKAKLREALMQIGNVSIPIITVDLMVDKIFKNASKVTRAVTGLCGVAIGVVLANFIMNRINNWIFKEPKGQSRKVQATDFSAHLDDVVASATYIAPESLIVYYISRLIPPALVIPGLETGNKKAS